MDWCRLWHDAPDDPKWRVIAQKAGVRTGYVWAVWCRMLVNASKSSERGHLESWDDEVEAVALDYEHEEVQAIRKAMQGKVLDGNRLMGWEKRQPKREDDSSERVKRYRKSVTQRNAGADDETQAGADVTPRNAPDKSRLDTDKKTDTPPCVPPQGGKRNRATRLPDNWSLSVDDMRFAAEQGLICNEIAHEAAKFADYWRAQPDDKARKVNWSATWRNWVRRRQENRPTGPPRLAVDNDRAAHDRREMLRGAGMLGGDDVASG